MVEEQYQLDHGHNRFFCAVRFLCCIPLLVVQPVSFFYSSRRLRSRGACTPLVSFSLSSIPKVFNITRGLQAAASAL